MPDEAVVLDRAGVNRLIDVLMADGYRVLGPTVRDDAIVLAELSSGRDLPDGWGVDSEAGMYRLRRRDDGAVFGNSAGPQSWKQFLHPPRRQSWTLHADGRAERVEEPPRRQVFFGVRACDLAAISVLNRVIDPTGSRSIPFIVAANCTEPGAVCFCASMGTGPQAGPGYDLALTERPGPRYVVEVGSDEGARILARLTAASASEEERAEARAAVSAAAGAMGRAMPEVDLRALLRDSRESPHWQDVASRCLTCGNCTMVCPTCYCTSSEDVTDLTGEHAQRWERWASCFELDYSYLHGGSVRRSGESRYRQWITHKLSTWYDQFGSSGCVGCGRCIAWCPTAIDLTAEVAALAEGTDA